MKVLWDGCENGGHGMTLGEIVQHLPSTTDWTNTTVRTLVIRLARKDGVSIDRSSGVYRYYPKISRADCIKDEMISFLERVFDKSAYHLVVALCREGLLTDAEKRDLVRVFGEKTEF